MATANDVSVLDELVARLGDCLTPESARRILALQADAALQARVNDFAERHSQGLLKPDEQAEYGRYVAFGTFVGILKSQARQLLSTAPLNKPNGD
jgi:hypothetical protein